MDYGIAVVYLLPGADYGSDRNYGQLVATWRDARPVPTNQALIDAYPAALDALRNTNLDDETDSNKQLTAALEVLREIGPINAAYPSMAALNTEIRNRRVLIPGLAANGNGKKKGRKK